MERALRQKQGRTARQYLDGREYDLDELAPYRIGYGEHCYALDRIHPNLSRLIQGRLVFPIQDAVGRVVGFSGRALGSEEPKYRNSPTSSIFSKKLLLYGLHHAKDAIREEGRVFLVEGYFDAIRCYLRGIRNVVATMGTAVTPLHGIVLARYTENAVLALDSDKAGQAATKKARIELERASLQVAGIDLPEGKDPDEFLRRKSAKAFLACIRNEG